jgi:nitroimidazol reductase NimA-like FMN-containing flavoprotein (pyridoxamine 5'-phosphate oxidase superfamily)
MPTKVKPAAHKLPSNADHEFPASWSHAQKRLAEGMWYWLSTVRPDGAPHTVPVLAVWVEDAMFFTAHPDSRKAQHIVINAQCTLSVEHDDVHLVLEGKATKVEDDAQLKAIGREYDRKYKWHVTVRDGKFDAEYGAPTAGPPPYEVYRLEPRKLFGFGVDETYSPTRFLF